MDLTAVEIEARSLLCVIAAGPHRASAELPPVIGNDVLSLVGQWARSESVDGLFAEAADRLPLTSDQLAKVVEQHRSAMVHVLEVERTAILVCAALGEAGIGFRLLKGVALARGVYADPSLRSFADFDLLVEPGAVARAVECLERLGGRRYLPEVRAGFDARFAKDVPVILDGIAVDVHRTLIAGPYGETIPVGRLLSRERVVHIGGVALPALDLTDAYLHAAVTAGAGDVPPRLITLRDMIELERGGVDATDALARARCWGVEAAVARAIGVLERELRPDQRPELAGWAERHRPARRARLILSAYLGAGRSYRRMAATMLTLPTWTDRLAFARAIAMPQRSYRAARGWTYGAHIRRAARGLVGRSR